MSESVGKKYTIGAALIAVIGVLCLTAALVGRFHGHNLQNLISPPKTEQGQRNLCGPYALFVAMSRLGVPGSFSEISRQVHPTEQGVSFGTLRTCARKNGLSARLSRLSWDGLKTAETPMVLWVDGNHFIALDPREKHPEGPDRVRIYEHGRPAAWCTRWKLETRWSGETLVVRRQKSDSRDGGPKVRWETCLQDCGFVDPYEKRVFEYGFQNTGRKTLDLKITRIGCGCAKAELTTEHLEPGGNGILTLTVDVAEKRGYFTTQVLLTTNDPSLPQCAIAASGGVYQPVLTSLDTIYFGEVQRGASLVKSFYVQDRGDRTLQILSVRSVLDKEADFRKYIDCQVSHSVLEPGNLTRNPISRYPVKTGDYLVELKLSADPNAPTGAFEGKVLIETNQPGRFASGIVAFKGKVISDIYAEPSAILLSRREPMKLIYLKSNLSDQVQMKPNATISGDIGLRVEQLATLNGPVGYRISVDEFKQTGTTDGSLSIEFDDKSSIVVPVVIYHGPQ